MSRAGDPTALLERIRGHLPSSGGVPALSDEDYMRCHVAFEGASDQQTQILDALAAHLARSDRRELSVLSVGAGSGILDVPLMSRLAERTKVRYCVIEPIAEQCDRLRERFVEAGLDGHVDLTVHSHALDELTSPARFDFVLAIHSIYYMPDLAGSLAHLCSLRARGGELIVGVAPLEEMNLLAQVFWSPQRPHALWFENDVERQLVERGDSFSKTRIEGRLGMEAQALEPAGPSTDIVDFLVQAPLGEQPAPVRELVADYLSEVSHTGEDGISVPHPAVLFHVG